MSFVNPESCDPAELFRSADWYNRTINWDNRLRREIPVFCEVFGPPKEGGIIDAGCGTGHQASALAGRGYRVVGADASEGMLRVARETAGGEGVEVDFVLTPYASLLEKVGGGFDGVYCLGNALAAAGTTERVAEAIDQFARCLRVGGRVFVQILNFERMRRQTPCVFGPRVATYEGTEYISARQFHFADRSCQVTNITMWNDDGWQQRAHTGTLYPIALDEWRAWASASNLRIDSVWGGYQCEPFDVETSADLIVVATKV